MNRFWKSLDRPGPLALAWFILAVVNFVAFAAFDRGWVCGVIALYALMACGVNVGRWLEQEDNR